MKSNEWWCIEQTNETNYCLTIRWQPRYKRSQSKPFGLRVAQIKLDQKGSPSQHSSDIEIDPCTGGNYIERKVLHGKCSELCCQSVGNKSPQSSHPASADVCIWRRYESTGNWHNIIFAQVDKERKRIPLLPLSLGYRSGGRLSLSVGTVSKHNPVCTVSSAKGTWSRPDWEPGVGERRPRKRLRYTGTKMDAIEAESEDTAEGAEATDDSAHGQGDRHRGRGHHCGKVAHHQRA